jgi:beta-lactamase regulating signal transducer with metallopeptidase domain/WD40 repeat protein
MTDLANLAASILSWMDLPFWETVIKSTLTLALAALACQLLGRHSAALRHRVWVIGLTAALVVPIASLLLPHLRLPVLPGAVPTLAATGRMQQSASSSSASSSTPDTTHKSAGNAVIPRPASDQDPAPAAADVATAQPQPETDYFGMARRPRIEQLLVFTWLLGTTLGSTLFVVLLVVQQMRLGRLRKLEDTGWIAAVANAAKTIGLHRTVDTLQSDAACVPAVVGILAPRLVIPANWRSWSRSQRHCVLLHELAHIKRCDVAAQLLGRLALLAYWFNPLVWYAVRQLRAERELASDDCVLQAGQAASDYAEQLLHTLRTYRPARLELGVAMAHSARLDQRVLAILDPQRRRDAASLRLSVLLLCAAAALVCAMGSLTLTSQAADEPAPQADKSAKKASLVWQENYAVEYPGTLPVSVAFSPDGKFLLTGDTSGELMTLILAHEHPTYRWKTKVGGSHPAVAYSADHKQVYATTKDGAIILDATTGKEQERIEVADSSPVALGVFPDKEVAERVIRHQVVLGNPRGYFVESWVDGKLADTRGTIETSTVPKDAKPADEAAVPLAVDPKGRSAIMTGPLDPTGMGGVKGKNVVWAYVCGDHDEGNPGNRILVGHTVTVVSAAWSKEGSTAVTGDADGRVIIWDAKTMKEARRLELGGCVAALAISDDGTHTAAYVLDKQGEVYVWDTAKPADEMKPIHTELADFAGPEAFASLNFAPDGKRLAGCAIHKKWLTRSGELIGKVRVWELAADPKAQVAPKRSYVKELAKESSANFVMLNNESLLMPARKEGAVDLLRISDGVIQARIVLGEFTVGGVKMSSDRKWLAIEQHAIVDPGATGRPSSMFDIGIYAAPILFKATIPACNQLLNIGSGRGLVAVVRDNQVELWDGPTAKKLKAAPFKHTQIAAAAFSPDGRLLAVTDRNDLVLWRWEEDTHERIKLGRSVGSLAFSPNGKLLAEGPSPGKDIQIRDLEAKKVVQTLVNDTSRAMGIPRLTFTQGGRVLVACDDIVLNKKIPAPHRIYLWDAADGSLAHQIEVPSGLPKNCEVSPNGRHLVVAVEDKDGIKLSGWRLDGREPVKEESGAPPAATPAR